MTSWPFAPLTPMKYGAVLADPPWAYVMRSPSGHAKSPEAHYSTMTPGQLKALPVHQLAGPDCMLFMWSTWPHLKQAQELMAAWGFEYKTGGAWIKRTRNWKLAFGTGYILRSACEPYLIGTINRPGISSRSERNVMEAVADKIEAQRREHSRKPAEMRQMIDRLLPDAYKAELFGREPWAGNDVWGNEAEKFARVGDGVGDA